MSNISIFCKSYRNDLERAVAMAESVRRFNRDSLPFYISVPQQDLVLFKNKIGASDVIWLSDEEIISSNQTVDSSAYRALPGMLTQQIIKAEFWRVNLSQNYLCLDSDSRFIRDFFTHDFLSAEGHPYTVLHEGKSFLEFCLITKIQEVNLGFESTAKVMRGEFGRNGPSYNFGPFPVIWSEKVWCALLSKLDAEGKNILDVISAFPHEASWYGEALLKYRPIPLLPKEPLFKAYLYLEEYEQDRRMGIDEKTLSQFYLGVVYQSNWYPKRLQLFKLIAYKIKRQLRRIKAYD